jgi:nitrogen regulatory protein P-II 2
MLITIVSEAMIEARLLEVIKGLGVKGYSVGTCRGDSLGSVRASDWEGHNVEIKTLVSEELSERILAAIRDEFIGKYALVAFRTEVEVLRGEKFS